MTAAARLFTYIGPSILRTSQNAPKVPQLKLNKLLSPPSLRFHRCSYSAVATLESDDASAHLWPEWVSFIDRLKTKGYIQDASGVYSDMKVVKEACLSFARDRFDIFKSLSTEDMKAVVENGCPNLLRKAVNSAKRLRAHLQLSEGDVCGSCSLRDSCDKAYVMLNDSEGAPRTVDVVRLLLLYALDPLIISGEKNSLDGDLIQTSSRRLLTQLIELDETPIDPELPKPASVVLQPKPSGNENSNKPEMKPGDWVCTGCNFMNFARNVRCRQCDMAKPNNVSSNYSQPAMKKGDWNCPRCSFMNFSRNRHCVNCHDQPRPPRQLRPGDWECPKCDYVNFSYNDICKKCRCGRPRESASRYDEHSWNRPY